MYKDKVLLIFDFAPLASVSVVAAELVVLNVGFSSIYGIGGHRR